MKTIRFPDGQPALEIQTFHEVARALTSSVDLTSILNGIMQQMTRFFSPEAWSLLIVDEKNHQLYYGVISGGQTENSVINAFRWDKEFQAGSRCTANP